MVDSGVLVWWAAISVVALFNLTFWGLSARTVLWREGRDEWVARYRRRQLFLSCGFVLGCATRSWALRADVQRFCMIDSFVGSVFVGRSIATVAELMFVAQWALLVDAMATRWGSRFALALSRAFVPTIVVAETCSWYAVLTTNYIGNTCEESLWTLTACMLVLSLVALYPCADGARRRFIVVAGTFAVAYIAFMSTVDVPMYLSRWRADQAAGRAYLGFADGLADAMRWRVTLRWEDWHDEIPWMSLYFSVATWISIALIHLPGLRAAGVPVREEPSASVLGRLLGLQGNASPAA